jgi:hypothetical protein
MIMNRMINGSGQRPFEVSACYHYCSGTHHVPFPSTPDLGHCIVMLSLPERTQTVKSLDEFILEIVPRTLYKTFIGNS